MNVYMSVLKMPSLFEGHFVRKSKETIWHFTCDKCSKWWSIASTEEWNPTKLYCPYCKHEHIYEASTKKKEGDLNTVTYNDEKGYVIDYKDAIRQIKFMDRFRT